MKFQKKNGQLLISGTDEEMKGFQFLMKTLQDKYEGYAQFKIGGINQRLAGKTSLHKEIRKPTEKEKGYLNNDKIRLQNNMERLMHLVKTLETGETTETD